MIGHRVKRHGGPLLELFLGKEKKPTTETASWTPIPEPLPGPQLVFDAGLSFPLPDHVQKGLDAVREKEHLARLVEGLSIFLTAAFGLVLLQMFLDRVFGLPWLVRAVFLGGDIVVLKVLWTLVKSSFLGRFLSDEEAALRVEKHFGFMEGALIGAVELAEGKPGATQGSRGLLQALIAEAGDKTLGIEMKEAISMERAWQWGWAALGVLALAIFLAIWTLPASGVLVQRLILLNPSSPSGTKVAPVTEQLVLQEGGSAILSARALGYIPSSGHVQLVYADGHSEDVPALASAKTPDLFSVTIPGIHQPFRYRFFLHDAEGIEYQVKMESTPVIQSLKRESFDAQGKSLGETAVSGRIHWEEGNSLKLSVTANISLKNANLILETNGRKVSVPMQIEGFGRKIAKVEIPESQKEADRFSIELLGDNNMKSADQVLYSLERVPGPKTLQDDDNRKAAGTSVQNTTEMRAKDRAALINLQSEPVPDEYTASGPAIFEKYFGREQFSLTRIISSG